MEIRSSTWRKILMHGRIWMTFIPRTENAGDCWGSSYKKMSRRTDFTYIQADFAKFSRLLTVIADIASPLVVAAMLFYPNRREFWALSPVFARPRQIGGKSGNQRTLHVHADRQAASWSSSIFVKFRWSSFQLFKHVYVLAEIASRSLVRRTLVTSTQWGKHDLRLKLGKTRWFYWIDVTHSLLQLILNTFVTKRHDWDDVRRYLIQCKPARNSAASRQPSKLLRETRFTSMTEYNLHSCIGLAL